MNLSLNLPAKKETNMKMEELEVLELLEEFEEVVEAFELDKKVKREFSLKKHLPWKNSLFLRFFSVFREFSLFL